MNITFGVIMAIVVVLVRAIRVTIIIMIDILINHSRKFQILQIYSKVLKHEYLGRKYLYIDVIATINVILLRFSFPFSPILQ